MVKSAIGKTALICAALMAASIAFAANDGVSVRASVDRKTILIGDRIKYKIAVTCPKGISVEPLNFKDNKIGEFEIKDSEKKNGLDVYYVTAYSVGDLTIPAVDIKYKKPGSGAALSARTDPIKITVKSVLPIGVAIADIKDIKGPIYFREFSWIPLFIAIALFLVAVFAFIVYRERRRRAMLRTPYQIAIDELEAAKRDYAQDSDIKEYYSKISGSVRRYIENVFNVKAPEMTTEEFLSSMGSCAELLQGHGELLKKFLTACDKVKFARYQPGRDEFDSVFDTAKNFIDSTRPKPPGRA